MLIRPQSQNAYAQNMLRSRQRVSEILNRRRRLTIEMIWNLHDKLGIPAGSLVKPYELAK